MITGEVISIEKLNDPAQNIVIWVSYSDDDGREFEFYKGATLLEKDGHRVWPLYCRWENFVGKTEQEINAWVQANVEHQAENIIKELLAKPILDETMVKDTLPYLVGKKWGKNDAQVTETVKVDETGQIVSEEVIK